MCVLYQHPPLPLPRGSDVGGSHTLEIVGIPYPVHLIQPISGEAVVPSTLLGAISYFTLTSLQN